MRQRAAAAADRPARHAFHRPVRIGEFVEAKCTVVRRMRSLVFMAAELVVGDRVVATANGAWKTLG